VRPHRLPEIRRGDEPLGPRRGVVQASGPLAALGHRLEAIGGDDRQDHRFGREQGRVERFGEGRSGCRTWRSMDERDDLHAQGDALRQLFCQLRTGDPLTSRIQPP
jgi:hypothetical protein